MTVLTHFETVSQTMA